MMRRSVEVAVKVNDHDEETVEVAVKVNDHDLEISRGSCGG